MILLISRQSFYSICFWLLAFSTFIAPPLFIDNAEWEYRRNWLLFILPLAAFSIGATLFSSGNRKLSSPPKTFISPIPGILFAITISGPLLLAIPTLNGQLEEWGMQQLAISFAAVSESVIPAIGRIQIENAGNFSNAQILKAQVVHSYAYFSFTLVLAPVTYSSLKKGRNHKGLELRYKWMNSTVAKIFMFPISVLIAWRCYVGWGLSDCSEHDDFVIYSNCALGDDLLLFVNAHFLPFFMVLFLLISMSLLGDLFELSKD